ncbi:MAG TPA: hypothetical protein VJT82_12750, partial [Pyrinomonadaceae bacterium]|nr:hypothetical protein [Pyrinomonadaceae bacterium]
LLQVVFNPFAARFAAPAVTTAVATQPVQKSDAAKGLTTANVEASQSAANVKKEQGVDPSKNERGGASQATGATKNAEVVTSQTQTPATTTKAVRDARKNIASASSSPAARGDYVVRVLNPRPGASAYESLALKMAKQRRYPENFTGGDTFRLRVKP